MILLAILTTHPIQYQVPLWRALAHDGRVPFEVWYLSDHGTRPSSDPGFGKTFAWDIDMLSGYPHRFLSMHGNASPTSFWGCQLGERLRERMCRSDVSALWVQGWQVAAYWQAVREAKTLPIDVWLRGESNDLAPTATWKAPLKRLLLKYFFGHVDRFLYIGSANRRLYRRYGVPSSRLHAAPYAVDNVRFAEQAAALRSQRDELRQSWGIGGDDFCVLFCGKFVAKKRPLDLIYAAQWLQRSAIPNIHLLFAGAGELGGALREACNVVHDAEHLGMSRSASSPDRPKATFAGFLNQTEVSRAYVAADCLVLPSDHGETWGLVVNEAMASGLPCLASDACGCTEDIVRPIDPRLRFPAGDIDGLSDAILHVYHWPPPRDRIMGATARQSFDASVATVAALMGEGVADPRTDVGM